MTTTPSDILTHLKTYLPIVSDSFTNKFTASAEAVGDTVTFTAVAHGLTAGEEIGLSGGLFPNQIASVVINSDGTSTIETEFEHDLTEKVLSNDPGTIELQNMGDPWDGTHTLDTVLNRQFFDILTPDGAAAPSLGQLVEDRTAGLIGIHTINSVTANTFTIIFEDVPPFPDGALQDVEVVSGYRIYSAADSERAAKVYTKMAEGKFALFLIMNDVEVSKDRYASNDSIATYTTANFGRQTILQNFSTLVFIPTDDGDMSGGIAQNLAYGDIYLQLYSVLYGKRFPDPASSIQYLTVNNGHGPATYTTAYYTHAYEWQTPSVLTFDDGINIQPDVAFRDIYQTIENDSKDMTLHIDLDKDPL